MSINNNCRISLQNSQLVRDLVVLIQKLNERTIANNTSIILSSKCIENVTDLFYSIIN